MRREIGVEGDEGRGLEAEGTARTSRMSPRQKDSRRPSPSGSALALPPPPRPWSTSHSSVSYRVFQKPWDSQKVRRFYELSKYFLIHFLISRTRSTLVKYVIGYLEPARCHRVDAAQATRVLQKYACRFFLNLIMLCAKSRAGFNLLEHPFLIAMDFPQPINKRCTNWRGP